MLEKGFCRVICLDTVAFFCRSPGSVTQILPQLCAKMELTDAIAAKIGCTMENAR